MPNFRYQILESGRPATGLIAAASLDAAADLLHARGEVILDLESEDAAARTIRLSLGDFGPGAAEIAAFTAQLAVMIRAGIGLRAAIEGIAEQADHPRFKRILLQIQRDLESGKSFSQALSASPRVFSPLYANMVKASEMSGGFADMLDRIAAYLNQQIETRNMVAGAMIYPAIIAMMAVATTIFLLVFVLPRFMILFAGKEAMLPGSTRFLMALSAFLVVWWPAVLISVVAGAWGFALTLRTESGKARFDQMKLGLPLVRKMCRALYISRGLQTMGQLVNAGVPILETLSITAAVSGNVVYQRMWRQVHDAVQQGERIAVPLQTSPLLPRAVVQMIGAGEESGRLGEALDQISAFYAKELKSVIKTATSLIEPAMILLMGAVVGFIAISIILPIFKLSQIVGR